MHCSLNIKNVDVHVSSRVCVLVFQIDKACMCATRSSFRGSLVPVKIIYALVASAAVRFKTMVLLLIIHCLLLLSLFVWGGGR